jgi:acyl-CoA thioesterase FadM
VLFSLARQVRFQDIDAAGILFYARAFEYFHDAYAAFLQARGLDLPAILREGRWGTRLGHTEADFKAPMRFGDRIAIDIVNGELGQRGLEIFYRVRAEADLARVFCTGMTAHAFVDVGTSAARDVPDEIRAIFPA